MKLSLDGKNYIYAFVANKNDLDDDVAVSEKEGENYSK